MVCRQRSLCNCPNHPQVSFQLCNTWDYSWKILNESTVCSRNRSSQNCAANVTGGDPCKSIVCQSSVNLHVLKCNILSTFTCVAKGFTCQMSLRLWMWIYNLKVNYSWIYTCINTCSKQKKLTIYCRPLSLQWITTLRHFEGVSVLALFHAVTINENWSIQALNINKLKYDNVENMERITFSLNLWVDNWSTGKN